MKRASCLPIVAVLLLAGCGGSATSSSPKEPSRAGAGPQVAPRPAALGLVELQAPKGGKRGIIRKLDVPTIQNDLRQIALLYQAYPGRVTSLKAFTDSIKREAPKIYQAIEDKTYIVILNARGTGIVAYEAAEDGDGFHLVARADGSVSEMSTPQLEAALKEQGN